MLESLMWAPLIMLFETKFAVSPNEGNEEKTDMLVLMTFRLSSQAE